MKLNEGDVVVLRSGGPLMTVASDVDEGSGETVLCVWFEGAAVTRCEFTEDMLTRVCTSEAAN